MKILLIASSLCLILSTTFSGCLSTGSVSAAQVKDLALATSEDINSYELLMYMSMNMETNLFGDDVSTTSMSINGNGIVDLASHKLMMEMTSSSSGTIPIEASYSFYFVDYVMYMNMDYLGETPQWIKMDFSQLDITEESYWDTYDQMQSLATLLEVSEVEFIDDQTINGYNCYGLKLIPDINKLVDAMATQFGSSASMLQGIGMDLSSFVDSFVIELWIAKDTNFIMKAYEYMKIDTSSIQSSTPMTMEMEITILIYNYNAAPDIELPGDANNAVDMMEFYESQFPSGFDFPT